MRNDYRFSELIYEATDFEAVRNEMEAVTKQVETASSLDEVLSAIERYDKIEEKVRFAGTLCYIRMSQDSLNPEYAKAVDYEFSGSAQLPDAEFSKALLGCKFLPDLEKRFGKEYRLRIEKNFRLKRAGLELIAKEGQLVNEYQRKNAAMRFTFQGKEYSAGEMRKFAESLDREVRKDALQATLMAYQEKKDEYISFLKKILTVRDGIAKANGFSDYAAYMDMAYDRTGYGKEELDAFCTDVKETLVPLLQELSTKQAELLGLDSIKRYDQSLHFPDGNPVPVGGVEALTKAASAMYDSLSPELGDFFRGMISTESFDIAPSNAKVSGMGFQTSLNRNYYPFVFANTDGTASDVQVFTHEIGHAWQQYLTWGSQFPSLYDDMVHDAVEIPSRTMEMFTFPSGEVFFGEDAGKFRYGHFCTALTEIARFCEGHELEVWSLTHPDASFAELTTKARELEQAYWPGLDGGELEHFYQDGIDIFRKMTLYMFPCYGIGYSLSWICAMQFYKRFCENKEAALKEYNAFCSRGGSLSYPELLQTVGMQPPYQKGVLDELVAFAREELRKLESSI
jgi:M3 family oligoendopeptidase